MVNNREQMLGNQAFIPYFSIIVIRIMPRKSTTPKLTLENLQERFPDELTCKQYIAKLRWQDKPVCPHCKHTKSYAFANGDYKCAKCCCAT